MTFEYDDLGDVGSHYEYEVSDGDLFQTLATFVDEDPRRPLFEDYAGLYDYTRRNLASLCEYYKDALLEYYRDDAEDEFNEASD